MEKSYKMQQILISQEHFHKWMQFPKTCQLSELTQVAPNFFQLTPNEHFDGFVFGQNPMEPGKNNIRVNVLLQIPEKIFKDKSLFALKERWKNR